MKKFLVGSKLVGLDNAKDNDIVVLNDEDGRTDIHYITEASLNERMTFKLPQNARAALTYMYNYQYDIDIIKQDFPYVYHILDMRNKYIEVLNWIVDNQALGFNRRVDYNNGHLAKHMYHVAYTTFIMLNNSVELTSEQKDIVQKIHDKQMPRGYLDELENIIRAL